MDNTNGVSDPKRIEEVKALLRAIDKAGKAICDIGRPVKVIAATSPTLSMVALLALYEAMEPLKTLRDGATASLVDSGVSLDNTTWDETTSPAMDSAFAGMKVPSTVN